MDNLTYKGYSTTVKYDSESHELHGKIEGITDFVNFVADDIEEVENEFHLAVDDYLKFCKEVKKEPAVPLTETIDIGLPERENTITIQATNFQGQITEDIPHQSLKKFLLKQCAI